MCLVGREGYRVKRVQTDVELFALEEPWTALLAEVPGVSIFLTWEWVSTWWRHYGHDKSLWVLTAWDNGGHLAGIAPWTLTHRRLGSLYLRRIAFIGSWFTVMAHLDIIARPDEKAAVCAAFVAFLDARGEEWDVLDLEGLAQDSVLKSHLAAAHGRHTELYAQTCLSISLPQDWDTFRVKVLSANKRQKLGYFRRQLERDYPDQVVFHRVSEVHELALAMDLLGALNRKRWHASGLATPFDNKCFVAFQNEFAALALRREWLRLYQLRVANQVIAAFYCFYYRDVFLAYQSAFDVDWGKYSPGQLMMAHAIRKAIEEGAHEFDMLSGTHEYKYSWANKQCVEPHFLLSTSWQGNVWTASKMFYDFARHEGRRLLPQGLLTRINRFLSARRQ
jgi:CelD/BcsL family acetyltransferase involved in cellulose biosynthesis